MSRYIEACALFFVEFIFDLAQSRKSYPCVKLYDSQNNDPNKFCKGYICEHSGLTESIINRMLNIDNKLRNRYVLSNNISNLYMLEWYPVLEYWAQDKANFCLPPTMQYEFYDFVVIQKYGKLEHERKGKDDCQIVVVSGPAIDKNTSFTEMKQKIIEYVNENRLHQFERLAGNQWGLNRKQVSQVGCGYSIRLNKTHYIDHLVCLCCAFEFTRRGLHYAVTRGPPCTERNYYQTEYPWRCGKHLCVASISSITNEDQKIQPIKSQSHLSQDSSITSNPEPPETPNLGKVTPPKTSFNYLSDIEKKPSTNELSQVYPLNQDKPEEWSLLRPIHKANQFSYRHEADFECNHCKYLVIFAAFSTGVVVIMAAYVFYVIKCYQRENHVTA